MDIEGITQELSSRLQEQSDPKAKVWWERYLKGEASFRGVTMGKTRTIVNCLWKDHNLEQYRTDNLLELAHSMMAKEFTEDKLAGVLLIAERFLSRLSLAHVPLLAEPLEDGSLSDWNIVDWYSVKVLGPFVSGFTEVEARATSLASWCRTSALWKRRAAAVAFIPLARIQAEPFEGCTRLILSICESNSSDPTRWSQTSVGWLLREFSIHHRGDVESFLKLHPELSAEAMKNARKHL
jgi:3-methyladenine DNA glycosylase AlkD